MEVDIRLYDLYNVPLHFINGPSPANFNTNIMHLYLDVPGVANQRPALMRGDKYFSVWRVCVHEAVDHA